MSAGTAGRWNRIRTSPGSTAQPFSGSPGRTSNAAAVTGVQESLAKQRAATPRSERHPAIAGTATKPTTGRTHGSQPPTATTTATSAPSVKTAVAHIKAVAVRNRRRRAERGVTGRFGRSQYKPTAVPPKKIAVNTPAFRMSAPCGGCANSAAPTPECNRGEPTQPAPPGDP